jgi:hypothetical protein
MNPKNPFPHYLNPAQGRLVNNLRFKITKTLKEFNRRGYRYKAKLELDYCRTFICKDEKVIFYRVTVIDFNYIITSKSKVKIEEVLDVLFLTAHIAVEFYGGR